MRNIWDIYKHDIKNITTNWVVAVLIGGLVILPSLYAWLNIKASWDPYAQTDQIPIGIVNEDKGAVIRKHNVHVGNTLVNTLKENHNFNWQFVNRKKSMDEVEYGNYYAVIVVPEDFTKTLGTVVTGEPEKARIEYYVNEKINAIAPKITDKGASVIVEQISSQFIATVNGVIFDMFNEIGVELEADLPDIKQFEQYLFILEKNLPKIYDLLVGVQHDAEEAEQIIEKAKKLLPEAETIVSSGLDTVNKALDLLTKAENRLNEIGPKIKEDLKNVQSTFQKANQLMNNLGTINLQSEERKKIINDLTQHISSSFTSIKKVEEALNQVQESAKQENEILSHGLENVKNLSNELQTIQTKIGNLEQLALTNEQEIIKHIGQMKELKNVTSTNLDLFIATYEETIESAVFNEVQKTKTTMNQAKNLLTDIQSTFPKMDQLLTNTGDHLKQGKGMLNQVLGEFPYIKDKVKELANRVRKLQSEADVNEIIELLKNDPEAERGFFAEPVVLNKNELFPIPNYGTGMTPFYTVLSLWVGCLLLISLLSTDLLHVEGIQPREMYIGRLLTFITIGMLQTLIVTIGDIFLIGVDVSSNVSFILFGLLVSFIFMIIVYTVVSVFGDVGKAIAIVLLVLQIAGSGGTYPVVLLPQFFQAINPFLPFTYAVDLMREAVGGIIWQRALNDILFLAIFGVFFALAGFFLKEPVNKLLNKLLRSKDSRLFH